MPAKGKKSKVPKDVKKYVDRKLDEQIQDKKVTYEFSNNIGTAGIILPIGLLSRGESQWTRDGSSVSPKWMKIKGFLHGQETAATVRVITGVYEPIAGALPPVQAIINSVDNAGTITFSAYSGYNQVSRTNFTVKSDHLYHLSGFNASENLVPERSYMNPIVHVFNQHVKLNKKLYYSLTGNTGTITDVNNNLPFVLIISDNNTNLVAYNMSVEFCYEDA